MEELLIIGMFIGLALGLSTGHPLAFILAGIGTIFGLLGWGSEVFSIFVARIFDVMNNYSLLAIPLFVLMANFLMRSEIAEGLFESIRYIFGPIRGGLGVAVIAVATVFAATTGIVGASVISMGLLGLPVLKKYGYQPELSIGAVCAGGTLGILIPPSIMLVLMGSFAQLSVGKLFMAAVVPGLLLSACYVVYILFICWRHPERGPALSAEEAAAMPIRERISKCVVNLIPPLILIMGVLGTIFLGVATPTEAAAVGAFLSLGMTFFYKRFSFDMLHQSMIDTAKTTAMCFVILIGAVAFTAVFLALNGDQFVTSLVEDLGLGKWGTLTVMLVLSFILGCFLDWIGIVMILFPIFNPILAAQGFDILYIATLNAVLLQTCFLTPPFGYALFYIRAILPDDVPTTQIYRGVIPFIVIICVVTALCIVFPEIIMWLPSTSKI